MVYPTIGVSSVASRCKNPKMGLTLCIKCFILLIKKSKGRNDMAEKKTAAAKKAPARKKVVRGDTYVCEVCGLAVTVDEACGCVDVCDIICCGKPMKAKKVPVKATKK
jgi:hypothetical protein